MLPTPQAWITRQKAFDALFTGIGLLATCLGLVTLILLILGLAMDGLPRLSWQFLTSLPSRFAERAGILTAVVGTALVMLVTTWTAVPLGVGAAIYLEEYARKNWLTTYSSGHSVVGVICG